MVFFAIIYNKIHIFSEGYLLIYLLISLFLYGLVPLVALIPINSISVFFTGLFLNLILFYPMIKKDFLKNNFKHVVISSLMRSSASILYFYAYDLGVGNIVVSLVFLSPIIYSLLDSLSDKSYRDFDLVLLSSVGCFLLTSKMDNFDFNYPFFIALLCPILTGSSLFYFKKYINAYSVKETISVCYMRSLLSILLIIVFFNKEINISFGINFFYSLLYGAIIVGLAMILFLFSAKKVESKTFSIVSNLEFIFSFIVMILVFNLSISSEQIFGLVITFSSLLILSYRKNFVRINKN